MRIDVRLECDVCAARTAEIAEPFNPYQRDLAEQLGWLEARLDVYYPFGESIVALHFCPTCSVLPFIQVVRLLKQKADGLKAAENERRRTEAEQRNKQFVNIE